MPKVSADILLYIACAVGSGSLIYALVLLKRFRACQKQFRESVRRSAEKIANLKNRNAELESAIRKKVIHEKSDVDLVKYFDDLLSRHIDGG